MACQIEGCRVYGFRDNEKGGGGGGGVGSTPFVGVGTKYLRTGMVKINRMILKFHQDHHR